jgi:hypothetical protein
VAQEGTTQAVVVVEPLVLPVDVDVDVDRKPTAIVDAGADVDEGGRWGKDDTSSGTLEEHYHMGLPQPSPSYSPCEHGWHHLL